MSNVTFIDSCGLNTGELIEEGPKKSKIKLEDGSIVVVKNKIAAITSVVPAISENVEVKEEKPKPKKESLMKKTVSKVKAAAKKKTTKKKD